MSKMLKPKLEYMKTTGCETFKELEDLINSREFKLSIRFVYEPEGLTDWFKGYDGKRIKKNSN